MSRMTRWMRRHDLGFCMFSLCVLGMYGPAHDACVIPWVMGATTVIGMRPPAARIAYFFFTFHQKILYWDGVLDELPSPSDGEWAGKGLILLYQSTFCNQRWLQRYRQRSALVTRSSVTRQMTICGVRMFCSRNLWGRTVAPHTRRVSPVWTSSPKTEETTCLRE